MTLNRLACATVAAVALATSAQAAPDAFETRIEQAKSAMMADPKTALDRSLDALAVARKSPGAGSGARIATAQWLQGEALIRLNRLDEAKPVIKAGLAAIAATPNTKLHGDLMIAEASILATEGQVQMALQDFQTAYGIYGKAREPRGQAMALMNIGSIYQDARDYGKVLHYYAQAADLYPGDLSLLVTARNNIGNAYKAQKKYVEAEAEFNRALVLAREMQSPLLQAHILTNLAAAEVEHGRLDAASRHVQEAERVAKSDAGARDWLPGVWGVAAQIEMRRGHPATAIPLIERAFEGVDLDTTTLLQRDFHETAYEAYSALGNDKRALTHLRAFKRLDDEARDLAASTNAALISARFDFANQASRIATLKAGQLQRDVQLARSRNTVTAVLLAGSLIIAALLLVAVLWIRRSRNAVRAANGKLSIVNLSLEKALNARTEFLATTSHEIRTPLNGILGMTEVILADSDLDPAVREKLGVVNTAGEAMKALIDDILDLSKIETGKMVISRAPMDLSALCLETEKLWADQAGAKGLRLSVNAAAAPARIVEDVGRLRQILFNLMSNAVKFTHEGSVTLTVQADVDPTRPWLVISVSDSGIGIPKDRLEDVFESFRQVDSSITRSYGGTGLGLAICRNLARGMGGDIGVSSTLGKGTTFTVRLPLEELADIAEPASSDAAPQVLQDCRLLLADANPLSQAVLKAVLQPVVRTLEAVTSCGDVTSTAGGGRFDLVLVEGAVLGSAAAERVIALRSLARAVAPTPVAVMVAGASEREATQLMSAGAAQIVHKPLAAPALLEALRDGLAARGQDISAPVGNFAA